MATLAKIVNWMTRTIPHGQSPSISDFSRARKNLAYKNPNSYGDSIQIEFTLQDHHSPNEQRLFKLK